MNREYQFITKQNERWHRRNLSRLMAITVAILSLVFYFIPVLKSN